VTAKAGQYLLVLLAIVVVNFTLPRVMPGDPTDCLTGTPADLPYHLDEEARAHLLAYHGLDQPLPRQFLHYLANLFRFDLGYAIYYKCPVSRLIGERLPWTLLLAGTSLLLSVALGAALGAVAAYRRGSSLERGLVYAILGMRAMPAYLMGMLAIVFFGVKLNLLPLGGATDSFARYSSPLAAGSDILRHMVMPVLVLTAEQMTGSFLTVRSSMVPVLGETYMLAAEAKGLAWGRRVFRYGMRNAVLPLYAGMGMHLGFLVTGVIFVETVFNYPGVGQLTYEAVMVHDYPVLQGVFLLSALAVIGTNALVDATYRFVDPRARAGDG
jgi:peptide/nickel transport system permease protein